MKFDDNRITLSSGRTLYAYGGVLGLPIPGVTVGDDGPGRAYYGWDGYLGEREYLDEDGPPLTPAERREITDAMIARWTAWALK